MTQQQPPLQVQTHLPAMQQVVDDVSGPLYHQRRTYLPPATNYTQPPDPPTIPQLAEFVATMIHLLWHVRRSSVLALDTASKQGDSTTLPVNHSDAVSILQGSDTAFQRFCQQILTATQLSESVVVLSLKYIAKLLQTSPTIQGAQGSEYRLFVVALLLANKFHDDNTFTNKTWADVSGMKLHELDIMELEFLGVLDFRLFIRKEEFDHWKTGLVRLMTQLQNATWMQEQQAIDSTLRSMGLTAPDPLWHAPTNNILTQQQYLYLLSTAQPECRPPSNAPLPRVPLRIPSYPVLPPTTNAMYQPPIYQDPSTLTYPAPARTSNRSIPRNISTLDQTTKLGDRSYQPYQRPPSNTDQPSVDYYAWKSLTKKGSHQTPYRQQR